jgi:hypothetical protein
MSGEEQRFDGLFMSAIQQSQGIQNFYEYLFSFMRRKTDFYTMEDKSLATVNEIMKKHMALFAEDKVRQDLIAQKQAEAKAKADASKP